MRSLLWYQICFLDFKTAEAQGPHPSIRSDDFDIPLPLNVDDDVFEFGTPKWQHAPTPSQGWTDVTLSLIRYECNELHRLIFRGRIEMDRKTITLHDLRARVESRKRHIHARHLRFLDAQVPIQRYAGLVATLLMSRCDSMLLYRHLPQTSLQPRSDSENRLRDVLLTAALNTLEIGATLDTLPSLSAWAWYSTTYQQYHAVLLLLTELYRTPDLARKDRMMTIVDHIFGHCYGIGIRERCSDLLWTVKENLEAFYIMKGVNKKRAPIQPLQQPPFRPLRQGSTTTPDFQLALQSQLQTPMDDLDFESLLGGLGGTASADGYEDFLTNMQNQDPGAIFMPADNTGAAVVAAAAAAGVVGPQGGGEWIDGMNGTTSPGARIGQWVCMVPISVYVMRS